MPRGTWAAVLVALAALTGCGDDEERSGATSAGATEPAIAPGCAAAVPGVSAPPPAGLIRPRGPLIVAASPGRSAGREAHGYLGRSPNQAIEDFKRRRAVRFALIETEGFEAEFVVSDDRHRNLWRVRSACAGGSRFTATITRRR